MEPREIHWRLCAVYGQGNVMAERNVYGWVEQFNKGLTTTHDEDWSGQPCTTVNKEKANIGCAILNEDRRYTLDDFHPKMATQYPYVECCGMSIFNILTNELETKLLACAGSTRIIGFASEGARGCGFRVLDNVSRGRWCTVRSYHNGRRYVGPLLDAQINSSLHAMEAQRRERAEKF